MEPSPGPALQSPGANCLTPAPSSGYIFNMSPIQPSVAPVAQAEAAMQARFSGNGCMPTDSSWMAPRLAGQDRPIATVLPPTEPEGLSPCDVSSPLASRDSLQRDVSKDPPGLAISERRGGPLQPRIDCRESPVELHPCWTFKTTQDTEAAALLDDAPTPATGSGDRCFHKGQPGIGETHPTKAELEAAEAGWREELAQSQAIQHQAEQR